MSCSMHGAHPVVGVLVVRIVSRPRCQCCGHGGAIDVAPSLSLCLVAQRTVVVVAVHVVLPLLPLRALHCIVVACIASPLMVA